MDLIVQNLFSPLVFFFILGIIASVLKSDLKFPSGLSETLSIYLLIAIGIKGGIELSHYSFGAVLVPILGALFIGTITPLLAFLILRFFIKLDLKNSIGLSATYGSISIVTYGAAISVLDTNGTPYEGFMNALVVIMESPAIIVSILLLKILENKKEDYTKSKWRFSIDREVWRESLFGKSIFLLLGSLMVGVVLGERALPTIKPLFIDLYSSILLLFLLNMGLIAGQRLNEVKEHGLKLFVFAVGIPIMFGSIGVLVGDLVGLSLGGTTLLGVLAGSASYIAAPAALKTSVPEANPSIYLGFSLGITFPFNLMLGIPFYFEMAKWVQ